MHIFRRILLTIVLLESLPAFSQIQTCIDMRAVRSDNGAGQGVYDFNNKWAPGATIRVSFLDGTDWQKEKVKLYAPAWCRYANIRFDFIKLGTGDVRVSFEKAGSYSFIGTDARNRRGTEETMNLGWIVETKTEAELKSVILHEFGHALGLLHEHMNPLNHIRWNKPVVYAWYLQYEGWDKEMVDKQVFDRYSVGMTNKKYDPKSIMHYPVPANFTTNGYAVGENSELSESDKKLIAELYPRNRFFPLDNKTAKWGKIQDLSIDYAAEENGRKGVRIRQDFVVYNVQGNKCIMAAYFYDADNSKPLADKNGLKASADGHVAAYIYFHPEFQSTQYNDLSVFMPYDELELGNGRFRLKCYVALFDEDLRVISSSGYQYFTFTQGINSPAIRPKLTLNDSIGKIVIMPEFTIENARGRLCRVTAYYYDEKGIPIKGKNRTYESAEGMLATTIKFSPSSDMSSYNNNDAKLSLDLPYEELLTATRTTTFQCRVVLYDDEGNKIQSSELFRINLAGKHLPKR